MSRALVVELGKINDRMQKIEETQSQILETQSLLKQQAAVAVEQHQAQTAYLQGMQPYLEARIKDVAGTVAADVLCREHVLRKDLQTMHAAFVEKAASSHAAFVEEAATSQEVRLSHGERSRARTAAVMSDAHSCTPWTRRLRSCASTSASCIPRIARRRM